MLSTKSKILSILEEASKEGKEGKGTLKEALASFGSEEIPLFVKN